MQQSNTFHQDDSFHYGDELDLFYNFHQGEDCFKNDIFQQCNKWMNHSDEFDLYDEFHEGHKTQ